MKIKPNIQYKAIRVLLSLIVLYSIYPITMYYLNHEVSAEPVQLGLWIFAALGIFGLWWCNSVAEKAVIFLLIFYAIIAPMGYFNPEQRGGMPPITIMTLLRAFLPVLPILYCAHIIGNRRRKDKDFFRDIQND